MGRDSAAQCRALLNADPAFQIKRDWPLEVRIRRTITDRRARGGWSWKREIAYIGINASLHLGRIKQQLEHSDQVIFKEYARIAKDAEIGDYASGDWRGYFRALTAHEFAHAIQFTPARWITRPESYDYRPPHGEGWQRIYRTLRRGLQLT